MFEKINQLIPLGNFIRNKSIQNFLFLSFIQSSNVLISIISVPLLIQGIGVDQFGLVNLSLSVIVVLNILVVFGYNLSAPREVALHSQDKTALSHIVSNVFSAKILLAAIASLIVLVGVFGLGQFREYRMILVFSLLLLFSEAVLPLWFFQGMEKMKLVSIANIFSKLLFLMGIVLFIHSPEQSKWVNFMQGFFGIGINMVLLVYIHRVMEIRFYRPEFTAIWQSIKDNVLLFFSNLASHLSVSGGLIVLSFFSNAESLGMYSLAERVIMVFRLLPSLIMQATFPNLSRLFKENKTAFYSVSLKVFYASTTICFMLSLGTSLGAPTIVELLSKGRFVESIQILKILAFIPFLASLNLLNIIVFLVQDQKNLMFKTSWLTCIFMLCVTIALTARWGSIGLAWGMVSIELAVFIISSVLNLIYNRAIVRRLFSK